jgi:hypothetical protein
MMAWRELWMVSTRGRPRVGPVVQVIDRRNNRGAVVVRQLVEPRNKLIGALDLPHDRVITMLLYLSIASCHCAESSRVP